VRKNIYFCKNHFIYERADILFFNLFKFYTNTNPHKNEYYEKLITFFSALVLFGVTTFAQVNISGANPSTNGNYSTLKAAFDAINATDQTNYDVVIQLSASITDNNTATLNAGAWNSLEIYPTNAGVVISGNVAAPMIDINGASKATIDGRVNKSGSTKSLVIQNTSNSTASNEISTIRFINGVRDNTVQYCIIKGAARTYPVANFNPSVSGNIFISTGGNSDILIQNNDITMIDANNRPYNGIYSRGATDELNTNITIKDNHFYDLFYATAGFSYYLMSCIFLHDFTSLSTIEGNHFYQTQNNTIGSANQHSFIAINSQTVGHGFSIINNKMGGREANCGGSHFTLTGSAVSSYYFAFIPVFVRVANTSRTYIDGNVIQNISMTARGDYTRFQPFYLAGGVMDIGVNEGNLVGDDKGNGSILLHNTSVNDNEDMSFWCYYLSLENSTVANNKVGSVTMSSDGGRMTFYGIYYQSTSSVITTEYNLFGSIDDDTNNSIQMISPNINFRFIALRLVANGYPLRYNTISKITNFSTNTGGYLVGIENYGSSIISNNIIRDLTSYDTNVRTDANSSVIGISIRQYGSISDDIIYNLKNVNENFAGTIHGIQKSSTLLATTIQRNFIYNIEATGSNATDAKVYGISMNGGNNIYNNVITLSGNSKANVFGIGKTGNQNTCNIYFNTVNISGTSSNTSAISACLYEDVITTQIRNIRNNIFINSRSTTDGTNNNYAAYFNHAVSNSTTLDYNNYFVSGTAGVLGYWNSTNKANLPLIDAKDANSFNQNPLFFNAGTTEPLDYRPYNNFSGQHIETVTVDYTNKTRSNPPYIGAFDVASSVKWTGSLDNNWNNEGNWYPRFPLSTDNIIIPDVDNKPTMPGAVTVPLMEVENNATWVVPTNGKVTLNNLSNAGNIVIESSNTHTGQLIVDNLLSQTGQIILRKVFTAGNWQFVSFPYDVPANQIFIAGTSTQATWGDTDDGDTKDFYVRTYDGFSRDISSTASSTSGYHWITVPERVFEKNKGYIIAVTENITLDFVSPSAETDVFTNNGEVAVAKYTTSPHLNHRSWNLIGQPFLSAFNLLDATQAHAPYYYYNGITYVAVMPEEAYAIYPFSSFFVQAHGPSNKVEYASTGRTLRSTSIPNFEQISVLLQDNEEKKYIDKTRIRLQDGRTKNYELGFDATKMFSINTQAPQIYTRIKESENKTIFYAVNNLPTNTNMVDLIVSTKKAGTYTISLENIDTAPSYNSIILVTDNKEYDLLKENYTFSTNEAQTFNWNLKLAKTASQLNTGVDVSILNNELFINGLEANATVSVYTAAGILVQVFSNVQNNQALTIKNKGINILSISSEKQQAQAKILVE
jgi:hypothetical protein